MEHEGSLHGLVLFSSLSTEQLAAVSGKLHRVDLHAGETLFNKGGAGDGLFIVQSGCVRMEADDREGGALVLSEIRAGEFFGELSLLDGQPRSATARAMEPSELLKLTKDDLFDLVDEHPGIAMGIIRVLSERLRLTTRNFCDTVDMLQRETSWKISPSNDLCPVLPLLDELKAHIGTPGEKVGGFIGLQHLMGSTATLVDHIVGAELPPDGVFLLGKPYSTNTGVAALLSARGYHVHDQSGMQSRHAPHDDGLHERVADLFRACSAWIDRHPANADARVLLIDDGGHAIETLHEEEHRHLLPRFTCVEQTRSGIRRIERLELEVPVINVAESWVKLEHESPMIAESVKIELFQELVAIESGGIPIGRHALIIGYGSVGRWVAARLRGCGFHVSVYDTSTAWAQLAVQDGFTLEREYHGALSRAELIIGCTGTPVMDHREYACLRDGAMLVSTSSSDIEFRAWQLRRKAVPLGRPRSWNHGGLLMKERVVDDTVLWQGDGHPCFDLYRVELEGRRVYLVKGGFPVNFTGGIDPIPPRLIQLTRALLFAGGVQASRTRAPGLHALSEDFQELIVELYSTTGA